MVTSRHFFLNGNGSLCKGKVAIQTLPLTEPESANDFRISSHPSIYNIKFDLRYFPENWDFSDSGQLLHGIESPEDDCALNLSGSLTKSLNDKTSSASSKPETCSSESASRLKNSKSLSAKVVTKSRMLSDELSTLHSAKTAQMQETELRVLDSQSPRTRAEAEIVASGSRENFPHCSLQSEPIVPLLIPQELIESTKKLWLSSADEIPVAFTDGLGTLENVNDNDDGRKQCSPKRTNNFPPKLHVQSEAQRKSDGSLQVSTPVQQLVSNTETNCSSPPNDVPTLFEQYKCSDVNDVVQFEKYVLTVLNALSTQGSAAKNVPKRYLHFVQQISEIFEDSLARSMPAGSRRRSLEDAERKTKLKRVMENKPGSKRAEIGDPEQVQVTEISRLESVWKRWNEQIEFQAESLPDTLIESLVSDSNIFEALAKSLAKDINGVSSISDDEVHRHYLLWPSSTSSFHNLVTISEKELNRSTSAPTKSLTAIIQILNRVMSYISQLVARVVELARNDDVRKKKAFKILTQEFEKQVLAQSNEKEIPYITASLKKLYRIANMQLQQPVGDDDDPLRTLWSDIAEKSHTAFRNLKRTKPTATRKPSTQHSAAGSPDPRVARVGIARPVPVSSRSLSDSAACNNTPGPSNQTVKPASVSSALSKRTGAAFDNVKFVTETPSLLSKSNELENQQLAGIDNSRVNVESRYGATPTCSGQPNNVTLSEYQKHSSSSTRAVENNRSSRSSTLTKNSLPKKVDSSARTDEKQVVKIKKKVQFNPQSGNPKLIAQLRGVKPAADFATLQTIFMDSGKSKPSSLLNPSNELQKAAVVERLNEMTFGGLVKYFGMLCEFVGGFAEHARRHAQTGQTPELPPPTTVVLPDLRELDKIAREIERRERH